MNYKPIIQTRKLVPRLEFTAPAIVLRSGRVHLVLDVEIETLVQTMLVMDPIV